jgi:hypothetical protein
MIGKIMNSTGYIRINSDEWQDVNKIYKVLEQFRRGDSSAVELTLEYKEEVIKRVVPYHWIDWIPDEDW